MGVAQFLTKVKGVARKIWDHAHKGTHSNFCLDPPLLRTTNLELPGKTAKEKYIFHF